MIKTLSKTMYPPPQEDLLNTVADLQARIAAMESNRNPSAMDWAEHQEDEHIQARLPDTEFTPYPKFFKTLPSLAKDFFRSPLPDMDRRRFLVDCPRNLLRNYQPPPVNSVNMGTMSRKFDTQLSDIQYRLSSLTRPLDCFLHRALQQESTSQEDVIDFVNAMHKLIMDTASSITQTRIDNLYRGTGMQGQAPRLADSNPAPLLDPKTLLDHISLQKSLSTVGRRPKRGKAQPTSPISTDHTKYSGESHQSRPNVFRKGFSARPKQSQRETAQLSDPVGGRLQSFHKPWNRLSDESWVKSVIHDGFKIPFTSTPLLALGPPSRPLCQSDRDKGIIEDEIIQLLTKRAIESVSPSTARFRSQLFTIPKKTGDRRPVLNLRPLNRFVQPRHFTMETLKTTCQIINQGDYLTSIDLCDAFLHVLVHKTSRKYLQFQWEGELFQFKVLPFGLSLSPLVFTKILRPVLKRARRKGISLAAYLDDMLVVAKDVQTSQYHTQLLINKLKEVGFLIKESKSSLIQQQRLQHLGFLIDTTSMSLNVPKDKVRDLRREATRLINKTTTSIRHLASFIGKAQAMTAAVFPARLRTRALLQVKNQALRQHQKWSSTINLTASAILELHWWRDQLSQWNGHGFLPTTPQQELYTDASQEG